MPWPTHTDDSPDQAGNQSLPVEVIIVNYNSTTELLACLASVYRVLGPGVRVLVEDNDSTDQAAPARERFPQAAWHLNARNLGFGRAVNRALARCRQPYQILLNPDAVLLDQDYGLIVRHLAEHPRIAALGPRILDPGGQVQGSARAFHTPLTALFGRKSPLTRWFPHNSLTRRNLLTLNSDGVTPQTVDWLSGACLWVRREAWRQVGGLDERFFMYFEDTDWCRRFWEAGWEVVYFPAVSVVHQVGASSKASLRPVWEFHRSCWLYLRKYHFAAKPWSALPATAALGGLFLTQAAHTMLKGCLRSRAAR
ncbi:MAG: glycosyltransferase family 2 protein [Deltaproteobacteria bacterium]|nr:glycosyltransferase family 2 protein [Deltaproteobacteria bacterium]